MATIQTIDATIFASSHPDIAKRTSVSGVLISSVMLLVGILAFASTFELEDKSSTVSMALMVLGTGLFLMGIFRLFWKFSAGSNIKSEASGNIRMDVILSADKKFAAVQLFQFIPYTYQPITSVQYFTDEQASAVIAFLAKSKMQ